MIFKKNWHGIALVAGVFLVAGQMVFANTPGLESRRSATVASAALSRLGEGPVRTPSANVNRLAEPDGRAPVGGLWPRIAAGLQWPTHRNRSRIQQQLRFFRGNQAYFDALVPRMARHAHQVVNLIEARRAPLELVLVPLIESGFRPEARSVRGIAGLWQFTPATADAVGLDRNEWYDARLDARESTAKAVDYLVALSRRYRGDWLLALAAFNAGEGTVDRALDKTRREGKRADFWSLDLNGPARDYVPKLLALVEVVRDPGRYGVHLPDLADAAEVQSVKVTHAVHLDRLADHAGIDRDLMRELNPACLRGVTPRRGVSRVFVPARATAGFQTALANARASAKKESGGARPARRQYRVQAGDTLPAIAKQHTASIDAIRVENRISEDFLAVGSVLTIPFADAKTLGR